MARLTINGQTITAREGQTVLEAASDVGIKIPTLCWHRDLSIDGSCRLCVVEVEGVHCPPVACSMRVSNGMVVRTETPALIESRRFVLEMLLRRYVDSGYAARDRDETEFEHWVRRYDVRLPEGVTPMARDVVNSDPNPFVWVDWNKCILCTRCVRACAEIQGRFVWSVGYRGDEAKIIAGLDTTMLEGRCESCSACVAYCPTGALDDKPSVGLGEPDQIVSTTCGYCGVGCVFDLNVRNNRIIRVSSNPKAPVNGMQLCVKGRYGYDYVHHPERLTKPLARRYLLNGRAKHEASGGELEWVEVNWDTALRLVAEKIAAVRRESGPDSIGLLASAKCTNEENYLMQKLARQVVGTHNIDHCARLCHSSTVAGLAMAFGSGAMSNSMDDVAERARAMLIIGSNTTEQHPVFGTRIRQAVLRRGTKVVVADPRKIDITEFAALHIRQRPGTDVALLNGIMQIVLENGWYDQKFIDERCEGFAEFRKAVEEYRPERVAEITGVSVEELHRAAEILALNKPMAAIWAMGITQHTSGILNVLSLANLQMLLGNMGVPGGGVNPLRGQNNVQGACDMGALPNVFPGYQPVTDPNTVSKFISAWALKTSDPVSHEEVSLGLSDKPGLTVTEMVEAFGVGKLRVMVVLGEDLAMTEPDINYARKSLASGEFLVLQEIFPSETSAFADVLLPGVSFAEKTGTFTNTERRVQMVHQAIQPAGEARQDWSITAELARQVLAIEGRDPAGAQAFWDYADTAAVMEEIAALTPSYAGVSHARLESGESLQWPVSDVHHPGTPIMHVGQFVRGKGQFHPVEHLPAAELPDKEYPFILTTGRVIYHWHGGELSRRSKGLLEVYPETLVEISPEDAARIGLNGDYLLRLKSRRGEVIARAVVTDRVAPGVLFGNFHFPGQYNINNLTISAIDPVAKIPEYKVCAVAIRSATKSED
ncbi:MAG TPA: formate dehydrogenase subunit alpha [Candidatus Binatia bacterium]|nr:formate dehydrogenase subunit alpha [Candidatus Binatia bacterium]